jgi:hypothetical protein
MMLARKWDRLENMLAENDLGYDIFRAIALERNMQGSDGTVLAEVRDLRRYLLLVEAEMVARGAVEAPPAALELRVRSARATVQDNDVYAILALFWECTREEAKRRAQAIVYGGAKETLDAMGQNGGRCVPRFTGPGTPEDGGHHEQGLRPPPPPRPDLHLLEDGVTSDRLTAEMARTHFAVTGGDGHAYWVVDRLSQPEDKWDHLPRLQREVNVKEWEETPPWYQAFYTQNPPAADHKYQLRPQFAEQWGRQP